MRSSRCPSRTINSLTTPSQIIPTFLLVNQIRSLPLTIATSVAVASRLQAQKIDTTRNSILMTDFIVAFVSQFPQDLREVGFHSFYVLTDRLGALPRSLRQRHYM